MLRLSSFLLLAALALPLAAQPAVTPQAVLVTGASSGIGTATAQQLDRRGDRLALLARSETGLAPSAGVLTDPQIDSLILFIKSLK